MTPLLFTEDDAWFGGFYEVAIELGPPSDDRLRSALGALWRHSDLQGCYLDSNREPSDQERVSPDSAATEGQHLRGVARMPNGLRVACGSVVIREEHGSDWLDFYLPMGSLGKIYPAGAFPVPEEPKRPTAWRSEVDDWLAAVGGWVARAVPIRLGLIGWEVSGAEYASDLEASGIPAKRYVGYLWPVGGRVEYHRRTEHEG